LTRPSNGQPNEHEIVTVAGVSPAAARIASARSSAEQPGPPPRATARHFSYRIPIRMPPEERRIIGRSANALNRSISRYLVELFPAIRDVSILRTWSGLCDVTPDYSPIIDRTPLSNFLVSAGWGTYGFKAAPIVGVTLSKLIATDQVDPLIQPFGLQRFTSDRLVSEAASAAMSH